MAGLAGFFFDTSVFVAGIIELKGPKHAAQRLMAAVASGAFDRPATAWHCCLEFYSVATRLPREFRVTPELAAELVEHEIMERFVVHTLPRDRRLSFVRSAAHDQILGGRIHDAHIAEIARATGADVVVTDNREHFTQLLRHGVRVLTTNEALSEL
jgi:predicted nucleic acid-binding protein